MIFPQYISLPFGVPFSVPVDVKSSFPTSVQGGTRTTLSLNALLTDGSTLPVGATFWQSDNPAVADVSNDTLAENYVLQDQVVNLTGYYLYQGASIPPIQTNVTVSPVSPSCAKNCDALIAQSDTTIGPAITAQVGKPFTVAYPMRRMDKSQPFDTYLVLVFPQGQRFYMSPTGADLRQASFSSNRMPYLKYDGSQNWVNYDAVLLNFDSFPAGLPNGDYQFYAVQVPAGTTPPDDPATWNGSQLVVTIK